MSNYQIIIEGFNDPNEFVEKWTKLYSYPFEEKYNKHIDTSLEEDSFLELFRWKNGTGDGISKLKMIVIEGFIKKLDVLKDLKNGFDWEQFENEFYPIKNSPIWKIFLLHLIDPNEFPIFDQHVFRFYNFQKNGIIDEIPNNPRKVYEMYKQNYKPWFNSIQREFNLNSKHMDQAFLTFGQSLKKLKGIPFTISIK